MNKWQLKSCKDVSNLLEKETFTAYTYNRRLAVFKNFFNWLQQNNYIPDNPLTDIRNKKYKKILRKERLSMTSEEVKLFLDAIKNNKFSKSKQYPHSYYHPFFYFMFRTGARNLEAVGLVVKNVNYSRKVIVIDKVLARIGGKPYARHWKATKTDKPRELPLTDDLSALLKPLTDGKKPDDLVFQSFRGNHMNDRRLQHNIFYPVLKKLGIEKRDLYVARHSFGSRTLEQGMTLLQTSELMGNSPGTVLKHYAHLIYKPEKLPEF